MSPLGESNSIRSIRCIGKKTSPGSTGSSCRIIRSVSSNEDRSIPLMASPKRDSSMIDPQNFSRGLASVSKTTAPCPNRPCSGVSPKTVSLFGIGVTPLVSPSNQAVTGSAPTNYITLHSESPDIDENTAAVFRCEQRWETVTMIRVVNRVRPNRTCLVQKQKIQ